MKVIHTELKNYNRRADGSVSLRCDSLLELSSQDIAEIDSHIGDVTIIALTDSIEQPENVDIDDILSNLPENDLIDNHKTPSQRLRGVLWYNCKQKLGRKPTDEEFADYYKKEYEKLIEHYKAKLEELEKELNEV